MDSKNYTQVLIDGKIYTLGGSEDESYLQKAASYVNEKNAEMRRVPGFSKQKAEYQMVMTELNIVDDYFKALERAEGMERQKNDMERETYSLKHELVSTQMKLEAVLKDLEDRQVELNKLTRRTSQMEGEIKELKRQLSESRTELTEAVKAKREADMEAQGAIRRLQDLQEQELHRREAAQAYSATVEVNNVTELKTAPPAGHAAEAEDAPGPQAAMEAISPAKAEGMPEQQTAETSVDTPEAEGMAEQQAAETSVDTPEAEGMAEQQAVKAGVDTPEPSSGYEEEPDSDEDSQTSRSASQDETVQPDSEDGGAGLSGMNEAAASAEEPVMSDIELARKALKAAKKAGYHKGKRR